MRQNATVTGLLGTGRAMVSVKRGTACGRACGGCSGCSGCSGQVQIVNIEAYNPANARVGDAVEIETPAKKVLTMAAMLYLMPPVLMIAAYFAVPATEWIKLTASVAGLAAGLGVCVWASVAIKRKNSGLPTIIAILQRENLH